MRKKIIGVLALSSFFAGLYFLSASKSVSPLTPNPTSEKRSLIQTAAKSPRTSSAQPPSSVPNENSKTDSPALATRTWKLDSSNFEYRVLKCFDGEDCELEEDPLAMYRFFKKGENRKAMDLLISYLRKNLKDRSFADRYKDTLKAMIDDFYPPEEKQFQEAAYYNYLGNLDKSLELYLDLEKKSSTDSTLRPAPKLNIANTYYDLGRHREALPYYQAALDEFLSHRPEAVGPNQNDIIRFIEGRIEEIKGKLRS